MQLHAVICFLQHLQLDALECVFSRTVLFNMLAPSMLLAAIHHTLVGQATDGCQLGKDVLLAQANASDLSVI